MSKIDIDITNQFYNNHERRSFDAFNRKMHKKRTKRLKTKDKKPLSKQEEFLYETDGLYNGEIIKCRNGFYKSNGVSHILFTLTKTNTEKFYDETKELNKKYPAINFIPTTIMDERHRKSFLEISSPNRFGIQHVGEFTPKTPELEKYIRFVVINAFGVSYDSICIDFQIYYTDDFLIELNKSLIDDFPTEVEYRKIFHGGRNSISYSCPMKEGARAQHIDDVLFELKARLNTFVIHHYSVFCINNDSAPLSVDEYRTNLDYQDRFISSYEYTILSKKQLMDFSYLNSQNNTSIGSFYLDYRNTFRRQFYELSRYRILFFVKDDSYVYMHDGFDFVLMFLLQNFVFKKYQHMLNSKYDLFERIGNNRYRSLSKIYRKYCYLCLETSDYQIFLNFNKLEILPRISNNAFLYDLFIQIKANIELLNQRNDELDNKINNILSSKNNSTSIKIAVIALLVSILSVLVAVITIIIPFVFNNG